MKPEMLLPLLLLLVLPAPPVASGQRLPGRYELCRPPVKSLPWPCDNFCSSNDDCPGSERCCSTGCGRECWLPQRAKRGFCPQSEPGLITACVVLCNSDSDCQGNEKCCHWGCSIKCMKPVLAKPGVCPRRKVQQTFAPCRNSCRDDSDCPGRTKCCFTGCGLGCLPPIRGRYGE